MSLIPESKTAKVAFFNSKVTPWTDHATAIGTTAGAVTAMQTAITNAQDKLAAQIAAQQAAKTATAAADSAVAGVVTAGSNIIKSIRDKAANSANPASIYELAQIPAPATPSPVNTLGEPTHFAVALGNDGSPTITWKCASPRATGTVYQIWRKLNTDFTYVYQGGVGEKKYTDATIPAGTSQVMYRIQAVRSTAAGPWAIFTVSFGTSSSGAMTATVTTAPKLAA